jgi:hypothetical protein
MSYGVGMRVRLRGIFLFRDGTLCSLLALSPILCLFARVDWSWFRRGGDEAGHAGLSMASLSVHLLPAPCPNASLVCPRGCTLE